MVLFISLFLKAQDIKPLKSEKKEDGSTVEMKVEIDSAKIQLRRTNQENTKDINRLIKLENSNKSLKEQLKAAKKAKKSEKAEAIQTKITDNTQTLKELDAKIKLGEKEIDRLEKVLKNAEKAFKTSKENEAKEKIKRKK